MKSLGLIASLFLSACSMSLPITGQFDDGSVKFTGVGTGGIDGSGHISLQGSNGLKVEGEFVNVTRRTGEGTFTASDGRSGDFKFVSTGRKGTGHGTLGGTKITFTFGL